MSHLLGNELEGGSATGPDHFRLGTLFGSTVCQEPSARSLCCSEQLRKTGFKVLSLA